MTSDIDRPVAVILAGGQGRRIGGRKAFVALGGRPLVAHAIDRLGPQVSRLALNASPDPAFDVFGLPVLPDTLPDHGPLAGILAAMDWAESEGQAQVVTVAVDTPFLPSDLVARLVAAACAGGLCRNCGRRACYDGDMVRCAAGRVAGRAGAGRAKGARLDRIHRGRGGCVRRCRRVSQHQHAGRSPPGGGEADVMSGFDTIIVADWSARSTPTPARPGKDAIFLGLCRDRYVATLYQRTRFQAMRSLVGLIDGEMRAGRRVLAAFDFPFAYPPGSPAP
jgi:hypothetical protein